MTSAHQRSPVSFDVRVTRLPKRGLAVEIDADAEQREALARAHGLVSVESYSARLQVAPWKRNGVRVEGHVAAAITQQCVVTLDPMPARIEEPVEAVFLPETSKLGRQGIGMGGEILIDVDGPDSPELFSGDTIDVGALAEEFFGLAIDPYPRRTDAALAPPPATDGEVAEEGELQKKLRSLLGKP